METPVLTDWLTMEYSLDRSATSAAIRRFEDGEPFDVVAAELDISAEEAQRVAYAGLRQLKEAMLPWLQ